MKTEYYFIINPKARSGMGEMVWHMLEPELKKQRVAYQSFQTGAGKEAEKIAAKITADGGAHTLVVLGGDGTVNEVVNGIVNPEKTTLGYIPVGSGNDFARGLGLPDDPQKALELILHPKRTICMDIGEIVKTDDRRRFAVSGGIGFDAAVCHEVCVSKWKSFLNRIGMGKLSYAVVALDRLRKDRPVKMKMILSDGTEKVFPNTYFAAFMNLPFEGGGFRFCPEASPEDGMLDVIVLYDVKVPGILFLLPLALFGKHLGFRGVEVMRCASVHVMTERALAIHTDGEPGFLRRDISVRLLEQKMKVMVE